MKKLILIGTGLTMAALLTGCSDAPIVYEGKEMPKTEAAERIADKLEVENPNLDLEVEIYEDID